MDDIDSLDVVIIGGGHSGCEAANMIAGEGFRTLLITINLDTIALVPGSPLMDIPKTGLRLDEIADIIRRPIGKMEEKFIVIDKREYFIYMKNQIEGIRNLLVRQSEVTGIFEREENFIISTRLGEEYRSRVVVICTGTFLKAMCIYDGYKTTGGRHGEIAANDLFSSIKEIGYEFKKGFVSSSHVVKISRELEKESERLEIRYHHDQNNSKNKQKFGYKHKTGEGYSVLFVPLGICTDEYYVSSMPSENIRVDVFNDCIMKLIERDFIIPIRKPYKVTYNILKKEFFKNNNQESLIHSGMFFAGAVTGSTGIIQSIMSGITAGRSAVDYLKGNINRVRNQ